MHEGVQSGQTASKRRGKKRPASSQDTDVDQSVNEAFTLLQQCVNNTNTAQLSDPHTAFGQYIASELRKYDPVTLAHVKHSICNIIFEADTRVHQLSSGNYPYCYTSTPATSTSYIPSPLSFTSPTPSESNSSSAFQVLSSIAMHPTTPTPRPPTPQQY